MTVDSPAPAVDGEAGAKHGRARVVWISYGVVATAVATLTGGCIWTATHLSASPTVHSAALFAHLAALITGFGAVLAVDWMALLWLSGRRSIQQVLDAATSVAVPIWLGYGGLVATGMLLEPDVGRPWTQVKLAIVVIIGVNGVAAALIHHTLLRRPSWAVTALGALSATISQACWWTATAVGFANAH